MNLENRIASKTIHIILMVCFMFFGTTLVAIQTPTEPPQETINKRIGEIMDHAFKDGIVTTPEGVRVTPMGANTSLEEVKEIKGFGERAIAPLAKYLDSDDRRAQTLATNLLGAIGGKNVVKPLSHAAEHCDSSVARMVAVTNLAREPWENVEEVIRRVSLNDDDANVRKTAQDAIAKHQAREAIK